MASSWVLWLLAGILIGYPLLRLAGAIAARPRRRRIRLLIESIKTDPRYSEAEISPPLQTIAGRDRPNLSLAIFLPLIAPIAVVMAALEMIKAKPGWDSDDMEAETREEYVRLMERLHPGSTTSPVWRDERFIEANNISVDLEMMLMPLAIVISAIPVLCVSPIILVAFCWRKSLDVRDFMVDVMQRSTIAIQASSHILGSR